MGAGSADGKRDEIRKNLSDIEYIQGKIELARAEVSDMHVWRLVGLALGLCLLTGIGWYVGQIEPDCLTAVAVLALYLLAKLLSHS